MQQSTSTYRPLYGMDASCVAAWGPSSLVNLFHPPWQTMHVVSKSSPTILTPFCWYYFTSSKLRSTSPHIITTTTTLQQVLASSLNNYPIHLVPALWTLASHSSSLMEDRGCLESARTLQQGCKPSRQDPATKPATKEFQWSQHQSRKEDGVHHQTYDRTKLVFISCILKINKESPTFTISSTSYPHNLKDWNRLQPRLLENYYLVRSKDSTTPWQNIRKA